MDVAAQKIDDDGCISLVDKVRKAKSNRDFEDVEQGIWTLRNRALELKSMDAMNEFELHLSGITEPKFELDKDEISLIASLCSEMRTIVADSDAFSGPHKVRLLDRISQVETEVHKDRGRLDVILGAVVDIGDAAGKFGEKIEPLTKRISEIRKITQSKTQVYDELPPPDEVKQLPSPDEGD